MWSGVLGLQRHKKLFVLAAPSTSALSAAIACRDRRCTGFNLAVLSLQLLSS